MTVTRVLLSGPPETPVAAEILDTESGEVRTAVVVAGRPFETELPVGTYLVRLTPPGLDRTSAAVTVPAEGLTAATVEFTLHDPRPAPVKSHAVRVREPSDASPLRRLLRRGAGRRPPLPPDEALRKAREITGTGVFVCDADGTLLRPVGVADQYTVSRPAGGDDTAAYLCVTRGQDRPARFVALPANCVGRVFGPMGPDDVEGETTVRPADPDARALLDYRAQGRLGAAAAVTDHVAHAVRARIEAGRGDPVAGCAVAYHLMDHPDRERAPRWIRLLADAFPSSADVSLLMAWSRLERAEEPVTRETRDRLIGAAMDAPLGLPVHLAGLRLLRTVLERLDRRDRACGEWDPRLASATRTVNAYLVAADPASPFVSYTGTGLRTPLPAEDCVAVGADRSPAPDTSPLARTFAKALDRLGTVTAGLQQTVSLPLLSLTWSTLPDGGGQLLSVDSRSEAARSGLAALPLVLVGADGWRMEVARLSDAGTATFSLPAAATARLVTPEPAESEDAVVVPPPVLVHTAASGPRRDHRVLTELLEFVLEPARGLDRWRLTARRRGPGPDAGWALVGQRSADDGPYHLFALPLAGDSGPGTESTVLLGKGSEPLDWYVVPEPAGDLPRSGREAILSRTLARAADQWTRTALQAALSALTEES
ncbi:hypothetical protein ABZV65_23010 [Streptomyces bauhiniae]|uniref:hypothetical protein n=1 Tax=Streptomyces bauhiniae TaxID=2340725 RepID=UPI0033B83DE9